MHATPDELVDALSYALRYEGRRRVHHADEMAAQITAHRLVQHLEAAGFVVLRKPSRMAPTTSGMPATGR